MFADKIKYTDFDGNEQEEEVRLYLSTSECKELDLKYEYDGGLFQHLKKLVGDKKGKDIPQKPLYDLLKEIIELAYGKKSEDGRRFIKRGRDGYPLSYEFMDSACYFALMESLLAGDMDVQKFITSIFPEIPDENRKEAENKIKEEFGL